MSNPSMLFQNYHPQSKALSEGAIGGRIYMMLHIQKVNKH